MSHATTPATQTQAQPKPGEKQCAICKGAGILSVAVAPGETYDRPVTENISCPRCGGKGTISEGIVGEE